MHPPSCQLRNLKERMGAEERRGEEEGGGDVTKAGLMLWQL